MDGEQCFGSRFEPSVHTKYLNMSSALYDKALIVAIYDMKSQITIEGCKVCWTIWIAFQKDKKFQQAKEDQKKKLHGNNNNT
jgi:hypothetical protein